MDGNLKRDDPPLKHLAYRQFRWHMTTERTKDPVLNMTCDMTYVMTYAMTFDTCFLTYDMTYDMT